EVTPHHLLLTDELARSYDPVYKVNPPLRTERDVMALREGVADGTIDVIATDHAPHPAEDKDCEWAAASFGMIGLETALSVSYKALVDSGVMKLGDLIERMSTAPARIGRYEGHGSLAIGNEANFTLVDIDATWRVETLGIRSKSKNSPYLGLELPVIVKSTYLRGKEVFSQ
ncbi:MAG: dihydroorotase, partial [Actinobacteria bacterium]|nr:dihydroorotase [Actinomycetota bacterium]